MKGYNVSMKHKGFTIVELIVVIVVIAILASITLVSYNFAKYDAMDARIRSTVRTAGDALSLYESNNKGARVTGTGVFSATNGMDTLIPAYLRTGYRDGITSKNATAADSIFRWYPCNDGIGGFVIYASLNSPTSDDTATFTTLRAACGHTATQAPSSGNPTYNYAQVF